MRNAAKSDDPNLASGAAYRVWTFGDIVYFGGNRDDKHDKKKYTNDVKIVW